MKFVALVSGGKDSCYNILHCLKNGHELIALGNLHPLDIDEQELNSYMFQTVGHDIVSLYEKTTDVPLYKHYIRPHSSKYQKLNYVSTKDDEIENLFELLSKIKTQHPDLEAVSVGAILSSYQRTRVENVSNRLGLTVLSYLWQRDQSDLMSEMCEVSKQSENEKSSKMDARLIKVAAIGLNDTHINMSLPVIYPIMMKLNKMYEVHICGEGGEFETMVLDAPFFKKGHLKIISSELDTSDKNNGVYSTKLNTEFVEREISKEEFEENILLVKQPLLLNEKWQSLITALENETCNTKVVRKRNEQVDPKSLEFHYNLSVNKVNNLMYISNILPTTQDTSIEVQIKSLFQHLDKILIENNIKPSQILSSTLYLSNIRDFANVNKVYNDFFDIEKNGPLPPSRACVETREFLPTGNLLQLSVIVDTEAELKEFSSRDNETMMINESKDGLHVQGISYWAPCNIGPYSQAIWKNNDRNMVSYISGQIALIPQSMTIVGSDEKILQSILSLKHFNTIKETIVAEKSLQMKCFISDIDMVPIVSRTWDLYCSKMSYESELWSDKEDDNLECLIIIKVSNLPRDALCEWGGVAYKVETLTDDLDCDSDSEDMSELAQKFRSTVTFDNSELLLKTINIKHNESVRAYSTIFIDSLHNLSAMIRELTEKGSQIELYYELSTINFEFLDIVKNSGNIAFNPVESIFDYNGNMHRFAVHATS
ncbi:hypothetical protein TPHA_0C00650 [Tetrapisispora phaffii CBS 4417]|uniref:Diphthine--ammonia ligase n=1 Tax=Tetrapisispora phaffii (strain ATCC 24235 / CBS 4417 / NBRC 1672 / NRRL Y-8282 / UCD 70-5) TaxID=1071381 RepID=G8BR46_TETPH|nr:hypothetical protein TPHA_0C00650 [Tetrapisispora phaffii CBS 4417]CCE62222.1 hypothetical protein TPHA_0C00650 [Tetrapisispora phaffii CBS 4417]